MTTAYPAVQRAIEVRSEVILAAKQGVNGVYEADPNTHPDARRFATISYDEVLTRGLSVMDQSVFILARDHELPIHVFDVEAKGSMRRICEGTDAGTFIGPEVSNAFS